MSEAMRTGATGVTEPKGFRVPMMFHPSHDVLDLDEAEAFYERLFGSTSTSLASMQQAGRSAGRPDNGYPRGYSTFTPISDVLFDTIDPTKYVFEGVQRLPSVEQPHLRLISWYIDGMGEAYRELRRHGIRVLNQVDEVVDSEEPPQSYGGGTVLLFTLPEDTGLRYSLMPVSTITFDARLAPGWSLPSAADNPLGIERCGHHTILTDRPERILALHVDVLGGSVVHEGRNELLGATCTYVHLAGSTIECAVPDHGTRAHDDWTRYAPNDAYHSLTWHVADLERAERHLQANGVAVQARSYDTIVTDPATSLGVPWGFTTTLVPGDPRAAAQAHAS